MVSFSLLIFVASLLGIFTDARGAIGGNCTTYDSAACHAAEDCLYREQVCKTRHHEAFAGRVSAVTKKFKMKAVPMNSRNPQGELLHKAKQFLVKYELTNNLDKSVAVNVDNTPLDMHELKENLVAESVGVYYYGVDMERSGAKQPLFGSFINIAPGETVTHIFDLGRYLLVNDVEEIKLNFIHSLQWHIVGEEENVKDEPFLSNTLTIPVEHTKFVKVDLGDRITLGSNGNGTRHLEGKELDAALHRNLAIKFTGSGDTHPNVPHFVYECSDVKSTGMTFPDGKKITCSDVARHSSGCRDFGWMCLKSCNQFRSDVIKDDMCKMATDTFTKPYVAKAYKTRNCNADQKEILQKAEEMKTAICKDILYELFHKTNHQVTTSFKAILERWIGESTERTVTVLQEGFSRICSVQDYIYECDPATDCKIAQGSCVKDGEAVTPVYTGQQRDKWKGFDKDAMVKCVNDGGIASQPSLTMAWVFSGITKPRIINLCQISAWGAPERGGPEQVRATTRTAISWGALLIHELSHFVDMANTDDIQYAVSKMIAAAKATPFKYVRNAASWDNIADDPDNIRRSWGDFKSDGDSGGGEGGGDGGGGEGGGKLLEMFKTFDLDNSGKVNAKELKGMMQAMGQDMSDDDIQQMLEEEDVDYDGTISWEEFQKAW